MDQDKFGKLIKDIRKKNNLTQKQLADKYGVTYQAVSKWENGKNMPDISLIKEISKDFNVSIDDMFDGNLKANKKNLKYLFIFFGTVVLILLIINFILYINKDEDFKFKTLSSSCENFTISGNIAYNDNKTSIYITNIQYCGGNDLEEYTEIECTLYESSESMDRKIKSYLYNENRSITLEEYLKTLTITVDDYEKSCKDYKENSFYLLIDAKNSSDKLFTYKIPLSLSESCTN